MVYYMFIKKEKRQTKSGTRTYIRIVDGYRDGDKVKHRSVKNYGYLELQSDPKAFMQMVEKDLEMFNAGTTDDVQLKISAEDNKLNGPNNIEYNYGYKYLETIYNFLKIDEFIDQYQNSLPSKEQYKLSDIFRFIVLERILDPQSKRKSVAKQKYYHQANYNFSLDDVYRGLTLLEPAYKDLQVHMRKQLNTLNIQKNDRLYYDVTNYYCEIDFNDLLDGLRKRGVSKEHRLNPIIGLGLFMDSAGLPVGFDVFPGNKAECTTLIPGLENIKRLNHLKRALCIADKGLNTSKNIVKIALNGDGYIFSQTIRGPKGKRFQTKLFNENEYTKIFDDNGELIYKYQIYEETLNLKGDDNKIIEHTQKVLLYWSKLEFDKQRKKRDEQVSRAVKSLTTNAYQIEHSFKKYIKKPKEKTEALSINQDLIDEEAKFDGYFSLVTSELHMDHKQIKTAYSGLWEIEESFRITKTDLEFRPINHHKQENIISHFLSCYTALLILRLFQYKLKQSSIRLSPERIVSVLNKMKLSKPTSDRYHLKSITGLNAYQETEKPTIYNNRFSDDDQIEKDLKLIYIAFGVEMNKAYVKIEEFNKYLRNIKFHTTSA